MKKDLRGRFLLYDVYLLISPKTGQVFYVGCTSNLDRRIAAHQLCQQASTGSEIASLREKDLAPLVAIVHHKKNREFALREESRLIALYGHFLKNIVGNTKRKRHASSQMEAF